MDCNKEEAERAKNLAEEEMSAGDFVGARKLVKKAQRLFPSLEKLPQMIAICDVHSSADEKSYGLDNWYGIHADTVKKQYRKLMLLLHPDKNKFAGAEASCKMVGEANKWLSDQSKRSQYDVRYTIHSSLASSGHHSAAANNVARFWTFCTHCAHWCEYSRVLMNTIVRFSKCQKTYMSTRSHQVPPSTGAAASGPDSAGSKEDHAAKKRRFLPGYHEAFMAEQKRRQEELRKYMDERAKRASECNERLRKLWHEYDTMHRDYFRKKKQLAASNETEEVNKAESSLT